MYKVSMLVASVLTVHIHCQQQVSTHMRMLAGQQVISQIDVHAHVAM